MGDLDNELTLAERSCRRAARLAAEGIATLNWWGTGCHVSPAFAGYPHDDLAATDELGRRVVGLPFWRST